jgi:mRNA interferase RelE/StbE
MAYRIEFSPAAARDLRNLPRQVQKRILPRIEKLSDDPRPRGCTKLEGEDDVYRIRVGEYRVLYLVTDRTLSVLIIRIRHRKEVYRSPAA